MHDFQSYVKSGLQSLYRCLSYLDPLEFARQLDCTDHLVYFCRFFLLLLIGSSYCEKSCCIKAVHYFPNLRLSDLILGMCWFLNFVHIPHSVFKFWYVKGHTFHALILQFYKHNVCVNRKLLKITPCTSQQKPCKSNIPLWEYLAGPKSPSKNCCVFTQALNSTNTSRLNSGIIL